MAVLITHGLRKAFGAKIALSGIDLAIDEGEVIALLGPTGAGKTTTLRVIAGLEKPDAGQVLIDGRDITDAAPGERDVAVVFEGFNLLPTLGVFDNIAFPLRSPVYREPEAEVRARVGRSAEELRISHLLDRQISQLSGGERQRVAIARALVRRPRVFLLDEPLSALDLKLREALQNELKDMHRKTGATVIYASHDFPSAAQIATRFALIEGGRILQTASLSDILDDPASPAVGRLVGSPSMALFPASGGPDGISLAGYGQAAVTGVDGGARDFVVGIWPEDILVSPRPHEGYAEGHLYATDFRGRDRAIEVRLGEHRFRKAVGLDFTLGQGEPVWFRLPPEQLYVFDRRTGARIDRRREGRGR